MPATDAAGREKLMSPVALDGVTKVYGSGEDAVVALDGVSLVIERGEMAAVMGPSGCGKSTLLNLIGCVDLPTRGVVMVDGCSTKQMDDDALTALRRDCIGTVFQFFNLLPALRVADNVALPLVLQRVRRSEIERRVASALEGVGLESRSRSYPAELSGGQLQRVAIARAIVHRPAVVLADEPTGNLDSQTGATVLQLLRSLAQGGQTIVMATHSEAAAAVCSRLIRMRDGRIV